MVISLLIPLAKAIGFSFDAPESVEIEEEFTVTIHTSETITSDYDVKIFVHESKEYEIPRSSYISEIYNEEKDSWADPWYYLKKFFPGEEEYQLRVMDSEGTQTLCVRLRKSENNEGGNFDEKCQDIEIKKSENRKSTEDDTKEKKEKEEEETGPDLIYYSNSPQQQSTTASQEISNIPQYQEKISLSASRPQISEAIETSQFKKRNHLIYSLLSFLLLLVVLLAIRKL